VIPRSTFSCEEGSLQKINLGLISLWSIVNFRTRKYGLPARRMAKLARQYQHTAFGPDTDLISTITASCLVKLMRP